MPKRETYLDVQRNVAGVWESTLATPITDSEEGLAAARLFAAAFHPSFKLRIVRLTVKVIEEVDNHAG